MDKDNENVWILEGMQVVLRKSHQSITNVTEASEVAGAEGQKRKRKHQLNNRLYWHEPSFQKRLKRDFMNVSIPALFLEDLRFENYFRMNATQFEELLTLVGTTYSSVLSAEEIEKRLALTLRLLASGDSLISLSNRYLIDLEDVGEIVENTCKILWTVLSKKVFTSPLKQQDWLRIANDFEERCDFKQCIGAMDIKHVTLQCPDNDYSSGLKCKNSVLLLAICDADYLFTLIEVGTFDSVDTGLDIENSEVIKQFKNKKLNVPKPKLISKERPPIPYYLVGSDAVCPQTDFFLKPYSSERELKQDEADFNKRINRAKGYIDNSLGIITSQWRILRTPLACSTYQAAKYVKIIACLHNYLLKKDIEEGESRYVPDTMVDRYDENGIMTKGSWRNVMDDRCAFRDITEKSFLEWVTSKSTLLRDEFCEYYNEEGATPI